MLRVFEKTSAEKDILAQVERSNEEWKNYIPKYFVISAGRQLVNRWFNHDERDACGMWHVLDIG